MAKSPDQRYATAEEFRADLLRFADGRPVEAGDPGRDHARGRWNDATSTRHGDRTDPGAPVRRGGAGAGAGGRAGGESGPSRSASVASGGGRPSRDPAGRAAVIAFFLVLRPLTTSDKRHRPDVVGQTMAQATQPCRPTTWSWAPRPRRPVRTSPRTTSYRSDPAGGAKVNKTVRGRPGRQCGRDRCPGRPCPRSSVSSSTWPSSSSRSKGLTYKVEDVTSTKPPGTVLTQRPGRTTTVPIDDGGEADRGRQPRSRFRCPTSSDSRKPRPGAKITGAKLTVGTQTTACSQQVSAGKVASQSPASGTQQTAEHAGQPRRLLRCLVRPPCPTSSGSDAEQAAARLSREPQV